MLVVSTLAQGATLSTTVQGIITNGGALGGTTVQNLSVDQSWGGGANPGIPYDWVHWGKTGGSGTNLLDRKANVTAQISDLTVIPTGVPPTPTQVTTCPIGFDWGANITFPTGTPATYTMTTATNSTVFASTALTNSTAVLVGQYVLITGGTAGNISDYRLISAFTASTGAITWATALPAAPWRATGSAS